MGQNLAQKMIGAHLVGGKLAPGEEIAIAIDQTLTQDATGTMAYLQFEALGLERVQTKLSVSYVDHNLLQTGFENADDHRYLQSVAARYGIWFSRPGNGICHQVHLERFARPGQTLLGSDSHTPTGGGVGMIAIGAGGLDVAVAMGGGPFYLPMPKVVLVRLTGKLGPWVSAKDVILELLRRLTVKGGVGRIMEYGGPGLKGLSVPERATLTNMGAELGATTSLCPSDEVTRQFLAAQEREQDFVALSADADAEYDEIIELDLSELEPLIAQPHMPDNVCKVSEIEGLKVDQVCVGSCTNSSYQDMMTVGRMLRGRKVHPNVSLTVSPGSRQVYEMMAREGALADMIAAGARILEIGCGPCIGMGQAPPSGGVSLRSFNRNFEGRSGTKDAQLYLGSVETCSAAALEGKITDPRSLGEPIEVKPPESFLVDDSMILRPASEPAQVEVLRGPNIKPLPVNQALPDTLTMRALLKVGGDITTDHIMPAGAKLLPLRSNIPALAEHVFEPVDPTFAQRAKEVGGGFVVAGDNYGQGSSREHAALAPMYLGVKAVLAKSFARIHKANLINFGIMPLTISEQDYQSLNQGDQLQLANIHASLKAGQPIRAINRSQADRQLSLHHDFTARQVEVILAGGLLNYTRKKAS